jgi:hypothetical protein
VLVAFQQSELSDPDGRILGVEEQLRGPISDDVPDLLARIDLLIETDEELAVVDFKTARSRWSAEQAATHQSQQTGVAGHSRLWKTV